MRFTLIERNSQFAVPLGVGLRCLIFDYLISALGACLYAIRHNELELFAFVGDVFEVGVVVFGLGFEGAVGVDGDEGATALGMLFEDAGIGKVVDTHTVSKANVFVTLAAVVENGEVVVVVVAAEDALQCVIETCLEEIARMQAAIDTPRFDTVHFAVTLAHSAVDKLHVGSVLLPCFYVLLPCITVFHKRNMEEGKVFDFGAGGIDLLVSGNELLQFGLVPLDLACVEVVVFPLDAQDIPLDIAMRIQRDECGRDEARAVFDLDEVIAKAAILAVEAAIKQAIVVVLLLVEGADFLTGIVGVGLGIVVAEREGPVDAQRFHQLGKDLGAGEVVEGTCGIGHGESDITGDDDEVGLLLTDHSCNGVHCPRIFLRRETTAAYVDIGELHHAQVAICGERPIAVCVLGRHELLTRCILHRLELLCLGDKRICAHHVCHG